MRKYQHFHLYWFQNVFDHVTRRIKRAGTRKDVPLVGHELKLCSEVPHPPLPPKKY